MTSFHIVTLVLRCIFTDVAMHTSNKTVYKGVGCGQSSKSVHVNVICTAVFSVTFFKMPPLSHEEGFVNKARGAVAVT